MIPRATYATEDFAEHARAFWGEAPPYPENAEPSEQAHAYAVAFQWLAWQHVDPSTPTPREPWVSNLSWPILEKLLCARRVFFKTRKTIRGLPDKSGAVYEDLVFGAIGTRTSSSTRTSK